MYRNGEGVQKDWDKASHLYDALAHEYSTSAEQGSPKMQVKLAGLYMSGLGVPRDPVQAYVWLRRAADQGDPAAMERLSLFYLTLFLPPAIGGVGIDDSENRVQSTIWLRLALLNDPAAPAVQGREMADAEMARLTPQQRGRVDAAIKDWKPIKEAPGGAGAGPVSAGQRAEVERLKPLLAAH
jgi:TPR repeat protein